MPVLTVADDLLAPPQAAQPLASTGQVVRAVFDEISMSGLTGATYRAAQLEDADQAETGFSWFGRAATQLSPFGRTAPENLSPLLSPEQGRQKLRDAGLAESLSIPEGGIRSAALDILIGRKRAEQRRQSILARPGASWPAALAGGLLGSLVDPTNIVLAFVPVVGEARYAQMIARAGGVVGRTGVRVGVGAVEGLVGLTPGEIANYAANMQQQADYDRYDFMLAIAGGAVFGSALHAGAGLFPEALGRYRPSRAAPAPPPSPLAPVAVDAAGAPVRTAPVVDPVAAAAARDEAIVLQRLAEGRPLTREAAIVRAAAGVFERLRAFSAEAPTRGAVAEAKSEIAAITAKIEKFLPEREAQLTREFAQTRRGNQPAEQARQTAAKRAREIVARERRGLEARRAELVSAVEHHAGLAEFDSIVRSGDIERLPPSIREAIERDADRLLDTDNRNPLAKSVQQAVKSDQFLAARQIVAATTPETQALAFRMAAAQMLRGDPINVVPAMLADPAYRNIDEAVASAQASMNRVDGADYSPVAPEVLDAVRRAAKGDEIALAREAADAAEMDVRESLASIGQKIDDSEAEELSALLAKAKNDAETAKVAAMCMMRMGE
jgi:hypothetical protein